MVISVCPGEIGGADGIVSRPLKKTEEKPLNSTVYCYLLISQCPLETLWGSLDTHIMPHSGNSWQQLVEGLFEVVQCRGAAIYHIPVCGPGQAHVGLSETDRLATEMRNRLRQEDN